mgnify:FL=1
MLSPFSTGAEAKSHDECTKGSEMRRSHNCVSVRHTKTDHCCWMKRDGTHGSLPRECCGTGWDTHRCEHLVNDVCDKHHHDM